MAPKSDHGNLLSWMWYLEHTSNFSTQDAEAGGSVQCQPGLHSLSSQNQLAAVGLLWDVGSISWS